MNNECTVYNPDGNCRCRIYKTTIDIDLPKEYQKAQNTIKTYVSLARMEKIIHAKNIWKQKNK